MSQTVNVMTTTGGQQGVGHGVPLPGHGMAVPPGVQQIVVAGPQGIPPPIAVARGGSVNENGHAVPLPNAPQGDLGVVNGINGGLQQHDHGPLLASQPPLEQP